MTNNNGSRVIPKCIVCKSETSLNHKFCSEECFQYYLGSMIGKAINGVVYPNRKN